MIDFSPHSKPALEICAPVFIAYNQLYWRVRLLNSNLSILGAMVGHLGVATGENSEQFVRVLVKGTKYEKEYFGDEDVQV